jgi:hypothetical protein
MLVNFESLFVPGGVVTVSQINIVNDGKKNHESIYTLISLVLIRFRRRHAIAGWCCLAS